MTVETTAVLLNVLVLLGIVILGWILRSFVPGYLQEKGKNLATKEDISAITESVEEIKARLERESEALARRRDVYDRLVAGLRVFVGGQSVPSPNPAGTDFMTAYRHAWIWAPDEVIREFNRLIELNRLSPEIPKSEKEQEIRRAYVEAVISMRRDAGHHTKLTPADYQFFSF